MSHTLKDRTIVMSGGSRGIGLAIALRAAADGANIVLIAKTDTPHPRLAGTIHTAAEAIRAAGGEALPVVGDVRSDETLEQAVATAVNRFGGVDVCVNNASVLNLSGTLELEPKRYDLMQDVNVRGTFMLTRACLPHLLRSDRPHVLTLSPPINLSPRWLGAHPGYLLSKYGMTLATLGIAAEFDAAGITATCLWPRTTIATDAVSNLLGGEAALARARTPQIMADAAYTLLTAVDRRNNGRTVIDDEVLLASGTSDLSAYSVVASASELDRDIFVD